MYLKYGNFYQKDAEQKQKTDANLIKYWLWEIKCAAISVVNCELCYFNILYFKGHKNSYSKA